MNFQYDLTWTKHFGNFADVNFDVCFFFFFGALKVNRKMELVHCEGE